MKLPNCEQAYIPPAKLTNYLLSMTHSTGTSKVKFFRALGFDESNTNLLAHGLITLAQTADVIDVESSVHGVKYVIEGEIQTPVGRAIQVRTIWIIDVGQDRPRFVTAYPL